MMSAQPNQSHEKLMECMEQMTDEKMKTLFFISAAVSMGAFLDDSTIDFCIDCAMRISRNGAPEPFSKPRSQAASVN